jgi:hypothetical protein
MLRCHAAVRPVRVQGTCPLRARKSVSTRALPSTISLVVSQLVEAGDVDAPPWVALAVCASRPIIVGRCSVVGVAYLG